MGGQKETLSFRCVLTLAARLRAAVSIPAVLVFIPPVLMVLAVMCLRVTQASNPAEGISAATPLQLDVSDDGNQLKVLVRHPEIGLVCELWCYEGGPFHYGRGAKLEDGRVVLVHTSRGMTATTTFTPKGQDRILMDILVEGPLEELKGVNLVGPCMQFWDSEAFKRRDTLVEFAERCFIYTMRGPVGMIDTARGPMKSYKLDAQENNPPWTQWYVPIGVAHPGDIWAFGASGDRPLYGVVGVASSDGRWLSAIGCAHAKNLGQGWHDCIHHVPQMQKYLDQRTSRILHRSVLYVMPNDRGRLPESFRQDFPDAAEGQRIRIAAGKNETLRVWPRSQNAPAVDVSLKLIGPNDRPEKNRTLNWEASSWGGFVRKGRQWRMWAYPNGETVDLCVSLKVEAGRADVEAVLGSKGWTRDRAPSGVSALVRRSTDGTWIAALMWEQSETANPARGVLTTGERKARAVSVRGRLYLYKGGIEEIRERWVEANEDWKHSFPYRMPVEDPGSPAPNRGVRFAPSVEEEMAYGLTIVSPWKDGGSVHVNFPEHLEYNEVGNGILRHHDKRINPWNIAPDGRSASYEIESLELPGVHVQTSAVADGGRARFSMKILNGSDKTLNRVKPLLCFWYAGLAGFPSRLSDNFTYTYVVMDGKPVALANIPTDNPEATAKVAYVRGCTQHDCDQFARSRGGLIERDLDLALIAVTARDGKRKAVIAFTPGKSILSNTAIPCAHADPYFGTLRPGESAEANGEILFTDSSLDEAVEALRKEGAEAEASKSHN